jgi:hypothetical protein
MMLKPLLKKLVPLLATGVLALPLAHADALSEKALLGNWHSNETKEGLAKGEMILSPHGVFSLQPEGMQALNGYWEASPTELTFYSPAQNKSVVNKYVLKGGKLLLTYPNGFQQTFTKDSPSALGAKPSATPKP